MARFHMHLHECGNVSLDDEGVDKPDLDSVRAMAVVAARDVMAAEVREGRLCLSCHIEVRDEQNCVVMVVQFRDVLALSGV